MERGFILVLVEVYEDVNTNFLLLGLAGASTISNIVSLQKLEIYEAYGLESLPKSFGNLTNLIDLKLAFTALRKLPASFGKLTNLQKLDLSLNRRLQAVGIPFRSL
jgi:Leucine-rich repeat (LRR) protein